MGFRGSSDRVLTSLMLAALISLTQVAACSGSKSDPSELTSDDANHAVFVSSSSVGYHFAYELEPIIVIRDQYKVPGIFGLSPRIEHADWQLVYDGPVSDPPDLCEFGLQGQPFAEFDTVVRKCEYYDTKYDFRLGREHFILTAHLAKSPNTTDGSPTFNVSSFDLRPTEFTWLDGDVPASPDAND